jgi:NAD(P)-dependent dehydrogenase (short-subunit alcohol dehydrogenase family)
MPGRLEGKAAVITGGGSGIGRACALRFASEGATVCVADLVESGAAETARLVEASGRKALALQTDTTAEAANDAMIAACVQAFGAVVVLVAAAGVGSPRPDAASAKPYTMLDMPIDRFRSVIDVNLYGGDLLEPRGGPLDGRQPTRRQPGQPGLDHVADAVGGRRLQHQQGRRVDGHQVPRAGAGAPRDPRQRHRPRLH